LALVLKLKMPVFPALLIASFSAALLAGMPPEKAIETVQSGMGGTLGFIAVVVGLGALLGVLLEVSGGVKGFALFILQRLGIERGRWSMGLIGLIVSIPVFLMLP
jgi:Gnt-I system low-affinity gluconate transporter